MQATLHINDNNLLLQTSNGIRRGRGYAWIKGDSLVFNQPSEQAAVKHCRLHPQQINSRYWQQCDQSSIPKNDAGMRHAADLIWQQLRQYQDDGVSHLSFVVPSHYQSTNLQLLLGIAKASNIKVTALVNKAILAASSKVGEAGRYCHIDVQLHQTVVSWLDVKDSKLSLAEVEVIQDVGINLIEEALLKALQASFIQNDRFDPLHHASYEQQLFDQLPELAHSLVVDGKSTVTVQGNGHAYSISYEASEFNAVLRPFLDRLSALNSNVISAYIDFNAAFDHADLSQFSEFGFEHVSSETLGELDALEVTVDGQDLIYQTEVSVSGSLVVSAPTEQAKPKEVAAAGHLYLVLAGNAVALENAHLSLSAAELKLVYADRGNAQSLIQSGQLFVLGDEGRKQLRSNDRLGSELVDGVLSVIRVVTS